MLDTLAPLFVLAAFALLAVSSWLWSADSLSDSLIGGDRRPVHWSR